MKPERLPQPAKTRGVLESSVSNAEALWRAFAAARGHHVVDEPGWLVVDAGKDLGGTRVILREPVVGEKQRGSLNRLVERASRPVVVEDPFASIDLHGHGFLPRSLPIMGAGPLPEDALLPDAMPTDERSCIRVRRLKGDKGRLLEADRIVVEGFPLTSYQPYQPGRLLPEALLTMPHISVFVAESLGAPSGACMTVKDTYGVGGVYWLAVLPGHRRAGIGLALMLAAMRALAGLPIVLSATPQGVPLYRRLGFETAFESTWWRADSPT